MRLIDADELVICATGKLDDDGEPLVRLEDVKESIAAAPTVDAVPGVWCKDCYSQRTCRLAQYLGDDGFCSYGERKECQE